MSDDQFAKCRVDIHLEILLLFQDQTISIPTAFIHTSPTYAQKKTIYIYIGYM